MLLHINLGVPVSIICSQHLGYRYDPRHFDGQGFRITPNRGAAILRHNPCSDHCLLQTGDKDFYIEIHEQAKAERDIGIGSKGMILLQVTGQIASRPGAQRVFYSHH